MRERPSPSLLPGEGPGSAWSKAPWSLSLPWQGQACGLVLVLASSESQLCNHTWAALAGTCLDRDAQPTSCFWAKLTSVQSWRLHSPPQALSHLILPFAMWPNTDPIPVPGWDSPHHSPLQNLPESAPGGVPSPSRRPPPIATFLCLGLLQYSMFPNS